MNRKAFTLIELAIVLMVIGLVAGGSFKVLNSMRERNRISEAKAYVNAAVDAVIGDAMEWDNLTDVTNFDQNISPVKGEIISGTLKMPLHYFPDSTLINNPICAKITTNLNVIDNSVSPARTISNVAFVIAHESANYNMQTALNSSVTPNTVTIYGPNTPADDDITFPNINRPTDEYDDIVKWVTLSELQKDIRCSDSQLRIVNNSLPETNTTLPYSATIVIDGNYSVPTANNCTFNSTYTSDFTYNTNTHTISSITPSRPTGTAVVNCTFTADGRTVSKPFVITINP